MVVMDNNDIERYLQHIFVKEPKHKEKDQQKEKYVQLIILRIEIILMWNLI